MKKRQLRIINLIQSKKKLATSAHLQPLLLALSQTLRNNVERNEMVSYFIHVRSSKNNKYGNSESEPKAGRVECEKSKATGQRNPFHVAAVREIDCY